MDKTKVLLPINLGMWTRRDIHTYHCITVCTKTPWNPRRLTITHLPPKLLSSPWCHWVSEKYRWKRKQTKPTQNSNEKRELRECFFFATYVSWNISNRSPSTLRRRTAKLPRRWQVARRLIPTSPFCGDAYQEPLLTGGYGKNRYKSAEVLSANACIQLMARRWVLECAAKSEH